MRPYLFTLAICLFAAPVLASAQDAPATPAAPAARMNPLATRPTVVALKTADGKDAGTATFRQAPAGLSIRLNLINLPPGDHAVHIHQNAVCEAPGFTTAGGHFNPDNKKHGSLNPEGHHNGDLPENITVGADGTAKATFTIKYLSARANAANSIFANGGTSIMVHAAADDMKTDPTGNAGARIACGVIQP